MLLHQLWTCWRLQGNLLPPFLYKEFPLLKENNLFDRDRSKFSLWEGLSTFKQETYYLFKGPTSKEIRWVAME